MLLHAEWSSNYKCMRSDNALPCKLGSCRGVEAVDEISSCSATWICQFEVYNHDLEITIYGNNEDQILAEPIHSTKMKKCREKFSIFYNLMTKLSDGRGCKVYLSKRHDRKESKKANNKQKANHPRQGWIFEGICMFR